MIGSLTGRLAWKQAPNVVVECNGVGYEVATPMSTFLELPPAGADVHLVTHLAVSDSAHVLYGFATAAERAMFRQLLRVNGVGAKMALSILSAMPADEFRSCIEREDTATLVRIPGVGRKTADRLILDLRDRLAAEERLDGGTAVRRDAGAKGEAVDALVALGYKPREVNQLVAELDGDDAEDIIRQALRRAVR